MILPSSSDLTRFSSFPYGYLPIRETPLAVTCIGVGSLARPKAGCVCFFLKPATDTNKTHTGRESKPGSKVASANHNTLFTLHPGSRLQPPIRGWFTEKEQTENRSGIIQENVQPPGLKVWSDPFSRK
uniref:Small integral membrane protein 20 isoform X1 n=1 Tax=Geotrypetes seraphini TaxID=260995 RepID=A0A6P8RJR7_GEOSA|nr:small integral membrane protein 20 isoform X1 [Geotrypetes seraphini]